MKRPYGVVTIVVKKRNEEIAEVAVIVIPLVFLTAIIIAAVIGSNQCTNYVYGV